MPKPGLAKLTRPRLHGAIPRERLFHVLDDMREHSLVWVVGPPGSGKTTLVASYLEAASVPAIWYLLDKGDSDPATFFYYLSQAVRAASRKRAKPLPLLTPEFLPDLEGFARRFMRDAFARLPEGTLIVVDNYHEISEESALHRMLNAAVSEVPRTVNLVVISRTQPPALFSRAKVGGELDVLGWDALRLDAEEAAAIIEHRKPMARELVDAIFLRSGGWVAGVRLMMEGDLSVPHVATLERPEALESTFDYFAAEVFDSAAEAMQKMLLRTAFLPRFTVEMAESISDDPGARKYIEQMFKRRLFVDRRLSDQVTYQYHDLFRDFLQDRARQALTQYELAVLEGRSADLLLAASLTDDAFALFAQAHDWEPAKRLLLDQAQLLITQGRWLTLENWGNALPAEQLDSNPWLRYWLGRSKALVNPAEAFPILEIAYESFRERAENHGQLLCAATVVETLHFVIEHWESMDAWLQRLGTCLAKQDAPLPLDEELRAHAALFWAAENTRDPSWAIVATSVEKVVGLLPQCTDANLRVSVANILHYHAERSLDARATRIAAREARPVLNSTEISADRHALYYLAEGFAHIDFARFPEALECFDKADAIIEANGLVGRDHIAGVWRALCLYVSGDLQAASATLEHTDKLQGLDLPVITQVLENARAWVAHGRGETSRALEHNQSAIDIAAGHGPYAALSVLLPHRAYMLIAAGKFEPAQKAIERLRKDPGLIDYEHVGGAIALLEAWGAHRSGYFERGHKVLCKSLRLAHDERDRLRMRWYPRALDELLPVALEQEIEVDVARLLISECNIAPPTIAPESWPWPIRIYTLGRFEVLINGEPLAFGRKTPKRTLALLKALIALGETDVPEQRLADLLWPDIEGDAAHESLAAALHRLRRLLGDNEVIRQSGNTLSINQQRCFVDARSFEAGAESEEGRESAIGMYQGDFLRGDSDTPWTAFMRERLRGKFIRAVEALGRNFECAAKFDDAIAIYLRGIEVDELVEPFYSGLMRCYATQGRRAEAAGIFRRLRQTLSITLGTQPAPETRRLFDEISLHHESP